MSNPFKRCALDIWQKGALIMIWVGQTAWATGSATTPTSGSPIRKQGVPMASMVVLILAPTVTISSVLTAVTPRVVIVAQLVGPARVIITTLIYALVGERIGGWHGVKS